MLSEKGPKNIERERRRGFRATFFDFFWDASRETPTFETIFGRPWSKTGFKSKRSVRGCPTKVKKKLRESAVQGQKRRRSQQKQ